MFLEIRNQEVATTGALSTQDISGAKLSCVRHLMDRRRFSLAFIIWSVTLLGRLTSCVFV